MKTTNNVIVCWHNMIIYLFTRLIPFLKNISSVKLKINKLNKKHLNVWTFKNCIQLLSALFICYETLQLYNKYISSPMDLMESFIPIEGIQTITLSSTVLNKTIHCSIYQSGESMCIAFSSVQNSAFKTQNLPIHQSGESMCNCNIVHSDQFRALHCTDNVPALIKLVQQQVVIFKTVNAIEEGNILSKWRCSD